MEYPTQTRPTLTILKTGRMWNEMVCYEGIDHEFATNLERIVLKNGVRLSVQASETHYCEPRDNYGPWFEVEVGVFGAKRPIRAFGARYEVQKKGKYSPERWYLYPWLPLAKVVAYIEKIGIAEEGKE